MELIHTLGIAIDPSAAKSGSAQAAAAFQQVGVAARATGAAAQIATKALGPLGAALGVIKKAVSSIDFEGMVTGLYETSSSLEKLQRQLKFASSDSADFRANFGFLRGVAQELGWAQKRGHVLTLDTEAKTKRSRVRVFSKTL